MAISIDREAIMQSDICRPNLQESLCPTGMDKYQYPYDPAAAKQLLKDAGYPNGFSFKVISYNFQGVPESPRLMEALAGYWQQIGLDPKITVIDYNTYYVSRMSVKTAGEVYFLTNSSADTLA